MAKVKLLSSKYKALFQISLDIGQVVLASIVVPPLLLGFDNMDSNGIVIIAGIAFTFLMWCLSVVFAQKAKL